MSLDVIYLTPNIVSGFLLTFNVLITENSSKLFDYLKLSTEREGDQVKTYICHLIFIIVRLIIPKYLILFHCEMYA